MTEGDYSIRVYLFHAGELLSWDRSIVQVKKEGIERYLYTLAFGDPYAYSQLTEDGIPNYFHWARNNVLCDRFFDSTTAYQGGGRGLAHQADWQDRHRAPSS